MKKQPFLMVLFLVTILCAQDGTILPGQKSAIRSLATNAGFVGSDLTTYLIQNYGRDINGLTRIDGAEIIKAFQAGAIVKPAPFVQTKQKSPTLEIATILDVGMKKRFHFRDGTIRDGEILSIKDDIVSLQTGSGVFNIPSEEFLSETAEITNKKGELFKGSVLGETQEEFVVRTSYGDAVVPKRDIHTMNRYHGGILDVKTEEKTKFYQGDEQVISVFLDPTAFPLDGNTFYLSGLSVGFGLTDRFMITTKFGSDFSGDLNLHPRMQFFHRKTADKEVAAAWGLGFHRNYPVKSVVGKYSHAINVTKVDSPSVGLNESDYSVNDVVGLSQNNERMLYAEAYIVFSSRRVNPTGRGKVGWTVGAKTSNAMMGRGDWLKSSVIDDLGDTLTLSWNSDVQYKVPFRFWMSLEYDLRKDVKFVGAAWVDNGYKTMTLNQSMSDYFGTDGSAGFSFDSLGGRNSLIDFDFGILYAINENFRVGLHFQQPYVDIYWEFFEF